VTSTENKAIENLLQEDRRFPPSAAFVEAANAQPSIYEKAEADFEGFWKDQALERIDWFTPPTVALDDSEAPFFKWFSDGTLNVSYNCLDRHLATGGDKIAYYWEGEPGDTRTLTYSELHTEVSKFANVLLGLGVERGDRVAIYMGMIPELPVAMLACARIGAIHSVVFGGFSSDALADRVDDLTAKIVITQDGAWRRGSVVPLKDFTDVVADRCESIEDVVVVRRCENDVTMVEGRDHWYHDLMADASDENEPRSPRGSCTPRAAI